MKPVDVFVLLTFTILAAEKEKFLHKFPFARFFNILSLMAEEKVSKFWFIWPLIEQKLDNMVL